MTTVAGSGYGRRVRHESEPMLPHERVEYWLGRVSHAMGGLKTYLHYDLRHGRYESGVAVMGKNVALVVIIAKHPSAARGAKSPSLPDVSRVSVIYSQDIDVAMRAMAWELQEVVHAN